MLCWARALECRLNSIIMMSIRHSQYLVLLNRNEDDLFVKKARNERGIEREIWGWGVGGGEAERCDNNSDLEHNIIVNVVSSSYYSIILHVCSLTVCACTPILVCIL